MLITCPSCAATYDLPITRIGEAGRKVRCAACRESWFVTAPTEEPSEPTAKPPLDDEDGVEIVARALPPPPEPPDPPAPAPASDKRRGKADARRRTVALAKVAALLFVCAAPPALYAFREGVVSAMPGTASLYRSAGLPVNLVGLSFQKVASHLHEENGATVLQVTGEIVNDGRTARPVPWLQIALEGEHGEPLYTWSAKAAEGELSIGRSAPFRVRLTAPPAGARQVAVMFRETRARRTAALD